MPGKGHTPNYGTTESEDSYRYTKRAQYTESPDRWRVVTMCALIVCLASMAAGMSLSFSSIIINELHTSPDMVVWYITTDGFVASLIGVSDSIFKQFLGAVRCMGNLARYILIEWG